MLVGRSGCAGTESRDLLVVADKKQIGRGWQVVGSVGVELRFSEETQTYGI